MNNFLLQGLSSNSEPSSSKLNLVSLLIYFVGYMIVGAVVLALFAGILVGIELGVSGGDLTDTAVMEAMILEKVFSMQIFLDAGILITFIVLWRKQLSFANLSEVSKPRLCSHTLILGSMFIVMNIVLGLIITAMVGTSSGSNEEALDVMLKAAPFSFVFAAVIFAPIVEELIFRGVILSALKVKSSPVVAVLVSGAIFGFVHVVGGLFEGNPLELLFFIQYFAMGAALGYVYYKTNNLHLCIGIHMLNNLIAVIMSFL